MFGPFSPAFLPSCCPFSFLQSPHTRQSSPFPPDISIFACDAVFHITSYYRKSDKAIFFYASSVASFFTDCRADCIGGSETSTSVMIPSMPM